MPLVLLLLPVLRCRWSLIDDPGRPRRLRFSSAAPRSTKGLEDADDAAEELPFLLGAVGPGREDRSRGAGMNLDRDSSGLGGDEAAVALDAAALPTGVVDDDGWEAAAAAAAASAAALMTMTPSLRGPAALHLLLLLLIPLVFPSFLLVLLLLLPLDRCSAGVFACSPPN